MEISSRDKGKRPEQIKKKKKASNQSVDLTSVKAKKRDRLARKSLRLWYSSK